MPATPQPPPDMDRLRWQCRRGMLELDEILLRYLEGPFLQASVEEQEAFRQLLAVEDPVLNGWLLLGDVGGDQALAAAVMRVRGG